MNTRLIIAVVHPSEAVVKFTFLPQFRYMIFHIFTCILRHVQVYYELTMSVASSQMV